MKNLKKMEEFIKEEWNIKDPFGTKKREQEYRDHEEKFQEKIRKQKADKLISIPQNQPPIIKELMDCIGNDDCIVQAKGRTGGGSINSQIRKAVLSNGMNIKLFFDGDDAGYDQDYGVIIDGKEYIPLTYYQYDKIEERIDKFIKNLWSEDEFGREDNDRD